MSFAPDPLASSGIVVVDKPAGMTSHDVVARLRRFFHTRKVGHAGTLDPMATGVLVVGLERGTKFLAHMVASTKSYDTTIRLGMATHTDDAEGERTWGEDAAALDDASLLTPPTPNCAELAALPEPKRRRALAAWLREQGVEVTREAIRGVDKLCTQWHGQGGVAVRGEKVGTRLEVLRVGGTLSLLPRSAKERSRARQS